MRHQPPPAIPALTATDLEFVVSEAAPEASDRGRLAQLVAEDEAFRAALLGDDRLVERVLTDEETFLRISPTLYFEVLLRRALKEMEAASHTVERSGRQSIPVFDAGEVVELIARPGVLYYLAEMLASFTRIRSHVVPVRGRKGVRRRVRYNDLDIDSLISLCATADEDHRFDFYRRIADVCLFTTGLFPEHAHPDRQASPSGQTRAPRVRRAHRGSDARTAGQARASQPGGVRGRGSVVLRPGAPAPEGQDHAAVGRVRAVARALHGGPQAAELHRRALPALPQAPPVRVARSLSEKQCSKRYASLVECKDANYSTTKSRLL